MKLQEKKKNNVSSNTSKVGDIMVIVNDQGYSTSGSKVLIAEEIVTSSGKAYIL